MVEENAGTGEHAVAFAVVLDNPVSVQLGNSVGAARVERRCLVLRNGLYLAEHLAGRSLVYARVGLAKADGFQELGNADGVDVGGGERGFPGGSHEGLCGEVVDFVGFGDFHGTQKRCGIGHVAKDEGDLALEVLGVVKIELALAADEAVNFVTLLEKELCQVRSVLTGNACNKCAFHSKKIQFLRFWDTDEPYNGPQKDDYVKKSNYVRMKKIY